MRTWHLVLVLTIFVSLIVIIREAPAALPPAQAYYGGGSHVSTLGSNGNGHGASSLAQQQQQPTPIQQQQPAPQPTIDLSPPPPPLRALPAAAATAHHTNGHNASHAALMLSRYEANGARDSSKWSGSEPPFIVLGIVSNVMWGNSFDRRRWIRETWKTYPNVGKTMHVVFICAMLQSDLKPVPKEISTRLRLEAEKHKDMLLLEKVPERKSPCLKTMAWFRHASRTYPDATFLAKTDDDAFVQTVKLEANMRPFAKEPLVYIGSTLWGSYITKTFEACARRMGPNMCAGGMKEEKCAERGAIGPYPYAVGMLQVLSQKVASYMVEQENFAEFERRATAATRPPMMDHGEDMVIGMFLYLSPWPLMPLHWGWDKLHDLCFKCTRKDQIWRPITTQTVVAHHIANEDIIRNVFHNITHGSHFDPRPCDEACQKTLLPFEVTSLADLCSRGGGSIKKVYSKCAMVGK